MNLILFDPKGHESLLPIVYTRPVAEIRVGAYTIRRKWEIALDAQASFLTNSYLSAKFNTVFHAENLFVNGSVLPNPDLNESIKQLLPGQKLVHDDVLIAFWGRSVHCCGLDEQIENCKEIRFEAELKQLKNTWNIIGLLKAELESDLQYFLRTMPVSELPGHVIAYNPPNIRIGENVKLEHCILNASHGAIVIDNDAEVMDGAILRGPVYIGKHSVVKMAAKIYGPFSCGEECRIGGEVSDSVFQSYSNKGHDGFLGHSYIGEWCNLGADTNVSNLKNAYQPVRLWNYASKRFDHTGMQFLGLIMGDHSKTGINTMINSGTVVGVACNLFGAGFPRNFIPSFVEGGAQGFKPFPLIQVLKMAQLMMARRKIDFTTEEKQIIEKISQLSIEFEG